MATTNRVHDSSVINSTDFDEMSLGAQMLYVKCVANADDYGVAEVESIFRASSKIRRPAIKELIDSGLVEVIRERGTIVYIKGFHNINSFTKHGARRSRYDAELMQNCYTKNAVSKLKTKDSGNPMLGEDRLGSVLLGDNYDRFGEVSEKNTLYTQYPEVHDALASYYKGLDELKVHLTDASINATVKRAIEKCKSYSVEDVCNLIYEMVDRGSDRIYWDNLKNIVY